MSTLDHGMRALDDALGARGRLLLLAGEPGIGKSRSDLPLSMLTRYELP